MKIQQNITNRLKSGRYVDYSLYLVIGAADCRYHALMETVKQAIAGGVRIVQLREKYAPPAVIAEQARALLRWLRPRRIPLIINDHIEIARAIDADGVHLGQADDNATIARARLGRHALIGLSLTHTAECARLDHEVDYVGVGPIFATASKTDAGPGIGLTALRCFIGVINLPVVAIGGIDLARVQSVAACAPAGMAVVSAICASAQPKQAAARLRMRAQLD